VPTDAALIGQVWQWQETKLADGSVMTVASPQRYTVEFMDDGIVVGRADCNRAGGIYTAADGTLILNMGVLTRAACPPGSLSTQFVQTLNQAATYQFDGDNLLINLQDGAGVMLFAGAN
jgi:heat shock protein HslJ